MPTENDMLKWQKKKMNRKQKNDKLILDCC